MNAIDTDRLPAEVRASIAVQTTPAFDLAPPEPTAAPTPAEIVALVETIQARDPMPEAAIAKAIGMTRQNFWQTKKGYNDKKLTPAQWRALQDLANGQTVAQVAQSASIAPDLAEPMRCTSTTDMLDGIEQTSAFSPDEGKTAERGADATAENAPVVEQPESEPEQGVDGVEDADEQEAETLIEPEPEQTIDADEPRYRLAFVSNRKSPVTHTADGTWSDLGAMLRTPTFGLWRN